MKIIGVATKYLKDFRGNPKTNPNFGQKVLKSEEFKGTGRKRVFVLKTRTRLFLQPSRIQVKNDETYNETKGVAIK